MAQEAGRGRMMPREDLRRAVAGYKALQRITVAIRSRIDLGRVLDLLAADAGRLLDLSLCSIARWDETGLRLVFSSEYRRDPDGAARLTIQGKRFEPGAEPEAAEFETVVFKEHMSLISTLRSAAAPPRAGFLAELAGSAYVVAPMIADQRVVGLLVAARARELPGWSDDEVEFLRAAADLAAVAIQHAALRAHLRVLSALAAEINSRSSVPGLLRRLTEAAMSLTQSAEGMAGGVEGAEMVCREICRAGVWSPIEMRFAPGQGLAGWSWAHRAPCVANDARNDPRALQGSNGPGAARSALAVPIVNRDGEVLGFFELHDKAAGVPYGEEDLHLVSSLAHHAAAALEAGGR